MRTTVDLPDDLLRRAKATAALRGLKLKDLIAALLEEGLRRPAEPGARGKKGPLPSFLPATGRKIPSMTNAEMEEILLREELNHLGLDRSA